MFVLVWLKFRVSSVVFCSVVWGNCCLLFFLFGVRCSLFVFGCCVLFNVCCLTFVVHGLVFVWCLLLLVV